jgi:hypothetical protein
MVVASKTSLHHLFALPNILSSRIELVRLDCSTRVILSSTRSSGRSMCSSYYGNTVQVLSAMVILYEYSGGCPGSDIKGANTLSCLSVTTWAPTNSEAMI